MSEVIPFAAVAAFHGEACPGLALGYRMAASALEVLAPVAPVRATLWARLETGGCVVDAVQMVAGCTVGNGRLEVVHRPRTACTFACPDNGRAVRMEVTDVVVEIPPGNEDQGAREWLAWVLSAPRNEVLAVSWVEMPPPENRLLRIAGAVGRWWSCPRFVPLRSDRRAVVSSPHAFHDETLPHHSRR